MNERRVGLWLSLALLVMFGVVAFALWCLPLILVDASAYTLPNGKPDFQDLQVAYNAARIPVGVAAAACVAAVAAGAGVWVNSRSLSIAREGLDQARATDQESRNRWEEEQLHTQFQSAAQQLGSESPAVRLAGVLALSRLADNREEMRESAVEVLCAYARMPLDLEDRAERMIRRAVTRQILGHLTEGREPSWSDFSIDLSGAVLEGFTHPGPMRVSNLFSEAAFVGFAYLDHVRLDGSISLSGASLNESFRLAASLLPGAGVWMQNVKIADQAKVNISLRQSESARDHLPGFVRLNMNNLTIDGGGLTVSLRGIFGEQAVFGSNVRMRSGELTLLMSEGEAVSGAVSLPNAFVGSRARVQSAPRLSDSITSNVTVDVLSEEDSRAIFDPDPDELNFV